MNLDIMVLGIVVSIIYTEITGFSPGGLVVAGFMVQYLHTPWRIVYTVAIGVATMFLVKQLGKYMILYGRRSFAAMVLVSLALNQGLILLGIPWPPLIGSLMGGIFGRECEKQGVMVSVLSLFLVMGMIVVILLWMKHPIFLK